MGSFIAWCIRLIFNSPAVIIGFLFAAYYKFTYTPQIVKLIFTQYWIPYAVIAGLGFAYAVLFKHVYYPNTKTINWSATIKSSFSHMFTIAVAAVFAFAVLYAWDYAFTKELDDYLRYKK